MTMTHKEALERAHDAYCWAHPTWGASFEAAIRAYTEALGLVLAPKDPTKAMYESARYSEGFEYYQDMIDAAPDPFKDDAP